MVGRNGSILGKDEEWLREAISRSDPAFFGPAAVIFSFARFGPPLRPSPAPRTPVYNFAMPPTVHPEPIPRRIRPPARISAASSVRLLLAVALFCSLTAVPARGRTVEYLAFGDSITHGVNWDDCACQCRRECGYPARLESRLRGLGFDLAVTNYGLGGETTPAGLTRIESILDLGWDVALLMEGTNDISTEISPETTIFNLDEMARKVSELGITPIHATVIPRFPEAEIDPSNTLTGRLASDLRALAQREGRLLIDPFAQLRRLPNLFELHYGSVEDHPNDPVGHPDPSGYDRLAEVFSSALTDRDAVPPVLSGVEPAPGSVGVHPMTSIRFFVEDHPSGVDLEATRLFLDGEPVSYSAVGSAPIYEITYSPSEPLSPGEVTVEVETADLASPPNAITRQVTTFEVEEPLPEICEPSETVLCLDDEPGDRRFLVRMKWETAQNGGDGGDAFAVPLAGIDLPQGGLFNFFPENPELLVKVLDGCSINDSFWVFVVAGTTLGYEIEIIDTLAVQEGISSAIARFEATNVDGEPAMPVVDLTSLSTCDLEVAAESGAATSRAAGANRAPVRSRPVPLADASTLRAALWLEGADPGRLAVKAARRTSEGWEPPATVAPPGPGTQTALTGVALDDGTLLAIWSAFDGEDDEILWSHFDGVAWSPPASLTQDRWPDITPAVRSVPGSGALLAWSGYDGRHYRLELARFDGTSWDPPRIVGRRGASAPGFGSTREPVLVFHEAESSEWIVAGLTADGQLAWDRSFAGPLEPRPRLRAIDPDGPVLEWSARDASIETETLWIERIERELFSARPFE